MKLIILFRTKDIQSILGLLSNNKRRDGLPLTRAEVPHRRTFWGNSLKREWIS